MKKKHYFGGLQILIGVIITIFVESVASGELLFTEGVLAQSLRQSLISQPIVVIGSLLFFNFIAYIYYQISIKNEETQDVFNNICKAIFVSHIKDDPDISNIQTRVTLFKAFTGYKLIGRFYLPIKTPYLKQVGRYQSVQHKKNCKIHYLPNEGCVGICYNTAQVIHKEITEFNKQKKETYYKNNTKTFNLSQSKTKKINTPSCSFLAFPVTYFDSDDVFGVVIFDSTEKNKMKKLKTRSLEEKILNYSAFFNHKSV